ncbi:hypothetical protein J2Z35_001195 [Acetoanaerobium pronyense]|uniref:Tail sheath protein C-terminal domain-containing protein n=1 Tax=Acetoanaerobium pronyense TaxID=1482736 RepID=A0ABS4KHZ7_9FIRM|nr:phage tail sheath C-terminal domain-containing protein [Acetoanaerobium pronyense]MBP2027401.1 hypothetical protein [Acetoanaerobium pronyense]
MANIGMPKIDVIFKGLAVSAIQRSAKGIVVLIVKEPTADFDFAEYKTVDQIEEDKFTAANVAYIKDVFVGNPSRVIVATQKDAELLSAVLLKVKTKFFNWIGLAEGTQQEQDDLATWIKSVNQNEKKVYKTITYNATVTDDMHIVNFANETLKPKNKDEITGEKYIARLLGLFAGLPFTQSATYYIMQDLESVTEPADLETAVNAGKLILFNDEFNYEPVVRVARAINSLITVAQPLTDDMKKITIVEAMDLMQTDISSTFKNFYIGKYKNVYDNQVLFLSAINSYFRQLALESILDQNFANLSDINVEKQRLAWLGIGKTEAETWTDLQVKINTFRSNLLLAGKVKILDAMEDLDFTINM